MNRKEYKVGDRFDSWFSGPNEDGSSTVLEIRPYTGRYQKWFNCILRLSSKTPNGYSDMTFWNGPEPEPPYNSNDYD